MTPMQTGMWADEAAAAVIAGNLAQHRTGIPLGKIATPEEVGQAAMFLLSEQASHITMADLYVDGGAAARLALFRSFRKARPIVSGGLLVAK